MSSKSTRGGAVRKKSRGKAVGSGGQGRQALEGRKPTPKAEDRPYHPAGKAKLAKERLDAARKRHGGGKDEVKRAPRKKSDDTELVTGRNAVLEALRTKIPATTLYVAAKVEMDDRMREILGLAVGRNVPVLEVMRPELDRMTSRDTVHQGVVLKVPAYEYAHPLELLDAVEGSVLMRTFCLPEEDVPCFLTEVEEYAEALVDDQLRGVTIGRMRMINVS